MMKVIAFLVLAAVSAHADILLSAGFEVRRYDQTSGELIHTFAHGEGQDGLVFGPDGNLYLAVNVFGQGAVQRYDGASDAFLGNFVDFQEGGLSAPGGIRFGPDGNLYVVSTVVNNGLGGAGRVFRFDGTNGTFIDIFVKDGAGGLTSPGNLVFGPDGNLYVSDNDSQGGVRRYSGTTGEPLGTFVTTGSGGLTNATGLVFGPDGNLYVCGAATDNVVRYNGTNGAFLDVFVPAGSGGLAFPYSLLFGPDGLLYVCSGDTHSVLRYNGTNGAFIDEFITLQGGVFAGPTFLTFSPPVVRLKISADDNSVLLTWPSSATNFVLESLAAFSQTNNWALVTNPPAIVGNQFGFTNSVASEQTFFRLRKE